MKAGCSIEKALGLVKREDTVASEFPELSLQWHPHKNGDKKPTDFTPGSGYKAWWVCKKGHVWQAVISSRRRGMGCPFCAGQLASPDHNFANSFPELVKEWDWGKM